MQKIDTPFGLMIATWSKNGLYACEFLHGRNADRNSSQHKEIAVEPATDAGARLQQAIENYFESGILEWELSSLDWSGVSTFHQDVLRLCFEIPSGKTYTYGRLAEEAGRPKAARAVGGAMANNRWPILIPCHRVVGASGGLTGYSGTGGVDTKRKLLAMEQELCNADQLLFT